MITTWFCASDIRKMAIGSQNFYDDQIKLRTSFAKYLLYTNQGWIHIIFAKQNSICKILGWSVIDLTKYASDLLWMKKKIQRLPLLVPIFKEISSIYRAILTLKTCQKPRHVWQKIVYLPLFFSTKSQVNSSSSETKVIWTMLEKKRSPSLYVAQNIFWHVYAVAVFEVLIVS